MALYLLKDKVSSSGLGASQAPMSPHHLLVLGCHTVLITLYSTQNNLRNICVSPTLEVRKLG